MEKKSINTTGYLIEFTDSEGRKFYVSSVSEYGATEWFPNMYGARIFNLHKYLPGRIASIENDEEELLLTVPEYNNLGTYCNENGEVVARVLAVTLTISFLASI